MVRSYPVRASIGGALLAVSLLTGCGAGDDDAAASPSSVASPASETGGSSKPSPDTSSHSSPDADGTATSAEYVPASLEGPAQNVPKPVMPELAKEESREGAQAFLDYWSDVKWYAYQTGDTTFAREIISPHCEICMGELAEIENLYQAEGWAAGGRESIFLHETEFTPAVDGVYKPVVTSKYEGIQIVDGGEVVHREAPYGEGSKAFQVYIDHGDSGWTYITAASLPGAE